MKVAIDALGIHYYGGGRSATLNLLNALADLDQENDYLIFLTQPEPSLERAAGNVRQYVVDERNRLKLRLWAQANMPDLVADYDLVHFTKNLGVFGIKPPSVVTVYDMTTVIHPELFPWQDVLYWRYLEPRTLQAARKIIAISRNTADDIIRLYGVPEAQIRVIYPAYSTHFRPAAPPEMARVRAQYALPADFVLHFGRIDRKKNLTMLVHAFDRFRRLSGYGGRLVLVGEEYAKSRDDELYATIAALNLTDHVQFTGPVPDADAPAIFSLATVTVFPSLHEGFGIVPLEALASGSPVITSRAGAVREAVGEAAFMLPSNDVESLANALILLNSQPQLRAEMRARGLAHAAGFSWEKAAAQTLALYREVVDGR